jgi:hypothetical protein
MDKNILKTYAEFISQLCKLYRNYFCVTEENSLPYIIRMMKSRSMRWAEHVAYMMEKKECI